MARKDDAPAISLFSFQDIITSLTGIMFLIVLLLILFMLEMRPKAEKDAARREHRVITETREDLRKLRRELAALQKNEAELKRRIAVLQQEDPEQIRTRWETASGEWDALRNAVLSEEETVKKEQKRAELAARRAAAMAKENRRLAETALQEKQKIADLRKRLQNSHVRAEQLKNAVRYTIENNSTLTPVLAECSEDGIRLLECATGKRIDLACTGGTSQARRQAFLDFLSRRNTRGEYYTILIKPETFEDAVLVDQLKERGIARGLELLPSDHLTIFGSGRP